MNSTLILYLPPRPHVRSLGQAHASAGPDPDLKVDFVFSANGQGVSRQGSCRLSELHTESPRADQVIAVPAASDLAWLRLTLPRANPQQLRAALAGQLEESLLDEPESLHFALAPDAKPGESAWVCCMNKAWLTHWLTALEQAQAGVDKLAPLFWPLDEAAKASGHFHKAADETLHLTLSGSHGVASLPLHGELARQLVQAQVQAGDPDQAAWSAEPAAAEAASAWLDHRVDVVSASALALRAMACPWNLLQFDLAPRTRGLRAVRRAFQGFMAPAWRPVRFGLITLLAVQVLGLNLYAWQQRHALRSRQHAIEAVLTDTFPQVRAVLDAPVQMQREMERLRAASGRAGDDDLESLLGAAAAAWPAGHGPVETLSFESGKLKLSTTGLPPQQLEQLQSQLASVGWQVFSADGQLQISKAARTSSSGKP
ncbi:MAG: general secretion pathway protein GspL [Burkholderiaceae bacterium]|nr:general secretion pathway protein GspL [Roseateles sp.]MBV8469282.1 general secretion pathway protein GspL [Burkholderiaceae bacterium]